MHQVEYHSHTLSLSHTLYASQQVSVLNACRVLHEYVTDLLYGVDNGVVDLVGQKLNRLSFDGLTNDVDCCTYIVYINGAATVINSKQSCHLKYVRILSCIE